MKKIYIAGPMTGLPNLNFPAFHAVARELRRAGHLAVNPAEINPDPTMAWEECMRGDIAQLLQCDAIHLLPGWSASRGATLEHHIASELHLEIRDGFSISRPTMTGEMFAWSNWARARMAEMVAAGAVVLPADWPYYRIHALQHKVAQALKFEITIDECLTGQVA